MATSRLHPRDRFWDGKRKPLIIGIFFSFLLLQLLFLGNLSYLYGVVFRSGHRVHALKVLEVNLDTTESTIQQSVLAAYSELQSDEFPSLITQASSEYPTVKAAREAVCSGKYWAAVVVSSEASSNLDLALGGGTSANEYNNTAAITLITNSAKYTSIQLGDISGNLQTLIGASSAFYTTLNPTSITNLNTSSPAAINAFRTPISSTTLDIMPTNQGPRVLYNTASMVMPIIQQFFFLMAVNGISNQFKLYTKLRLLHALLMRFVLSTTYTFISSLGMAGYIWAFREDWDVSGAQFGLTWMVVWLYMFVNFAVIDAATGFIPISFLPFFIFTWIIMNISSTIFPFELSPGFYRWGYALPGVNAYQMMADVWSGGCEKVAYRALPILFGWTVGGVGLAMWAMVRRCRVAAEAEAVEEEVLVKKADCGTPSSVRVSEEQWSPAPAREDDGEHLTVREDGDVEGQIELRPYPSQISGVAIRMPFADTIERL